MTTYTFTADHTSEAWRFKDEPIEVHTDPQGGFYVTHPRLGCSRTYRHATPEEAIRMLLREHGARSIYVTSPAAPAARREGV